MCIRDSNIIALGRDASATANDSFAFGNGVTADLAGLVALGSVVNSFRLPGIASDLSRSRQSGDVFFVTSDADGNLATTTTPVSGKTSASKSVADTPVVTNTAAVDTAAETDQPSQLNALDERDASGLSGPTAGPLTGVSDDAIFGSNLTAEAQPVATPIAATGAAAEDVLTNTNNICLLYTSPSPRDATLSRMPSSA